ncbi:MAG: hypothetical protein FJ090_05285 [Deltaproteobacteria bacterium]|nr:hypothetical protein [Deltaproteobacteria bacterium]
MRLRRCRADCGRDTPEHEYRDASYARQISPDQAELDAALGPLLFPAARLLHVGLGCSSVARAYAARVAAIDGITVLPEELHAAPALPNYRTWLLNKHAPGLRALPGPYDFIVDNNPGTFACCRRHFEAMFDAYAALLAPGGRILTHARGAGWGGAIRLAYRHWAALGRARGLQAAQVSPSVWELLAAGSAPR